MGLFRLIATAAAGYGLYKLYRKAPTAEPAALAPGEATGTGVTEIRSAGPEGMRSDPPNWDAVDEASDESFPASDPPAKY